MTSHERKDPIWHEAINTAISEISQIEAVRNNQQLHDEILQKLVNLKEPPWQHPDFRCQSCGKRGADPSGHLSVSFLNDGMKLYCLDCAEAIEAENTSLMDRIAPYMEDRD